MGASWINGKPSSLGLVSGAIAGLVAITPAAGFVDPLSAIVIGLVAGFICYRALTFRLKKGLDESLDAWAIHGTGGIWGAIATGIFATLAVNKYSGLLYGNIAQFGAQLLAASVAVVYAFTVTFVLAKVVDRFLGLRVTEEEEYVGLDISQHGERAYN
jgi:Amt family ammonium transporter